MILYGRDRDERDPISDDSANRYPIGTRRLAAHEASGDDPHDLDDGPSALAQSDYNKMATTGFLFCLSCLLAWLLILAFSVGPLSKKADVQKAAGQTVGYRNTPPLASPPAAAAALKSPAPLSSSADALPLQEILTGVPPLSNPNPKETR